MQTVRIKIDDLFQFGDEQRPAGPLDVVALTPVVLKQFSFLPQPLFISLDHDEVVLQFPEEPSAAQDEAKRLALKAVKRATEGSYQKAISIYQRVLELHPSFHDARRDMAMAYVEIGDVENATNHLIELLRLRPGDAWSWVVLGNLYVGKKQDLDTGEKFLRKALEIAPNDAWALNSLAAVYHQRGKRSEAIETFERAVSANPDFANPYYGLAAALCDSNEFEKAADALSRLFELAKIQDARSKPVFERARMLFRQVQTSLASRNHSDAFKAVEDYKANVAAASGFPIRVEIADFKDGVGATIQMAWKHGRDYHLIKTRNGYEPELLIHLEAHELTHLKFESEARRVGKNLFFSTTANSREVAIRSLASDIRRLEKDGYSGESITTVTLTMVGGLCGFLFNCPLDMLIERELRSSLPLLRPAQFLSVGVMAGEAAKANSNQEIRRLTPRKILRASLALNGAYTLFLDDLFKGASDFSAPYRQEDSFSMSRQLYDHWKARSANLTPGDEYQLVDDFAEMLGLRDWYEWKPDNGAAPLTVADDATPQGTTNPELLRAKHPASVFYFLDAFKRFDSMTPKEIRDIAFEIAWKGQTGLDYASPDEKYELKSLPGRKFTGLHLMCLMYAGFKRVAPEQDLGMDLHEPFLTALQLHETDGTEHE